LQATGLSRDHDLTTPLERLAGIRSQIELGEEFIEGADIGGIGKEVTVTVEQDGEVRCENDDRKRKASKRIPGQA